MRRMGRRWLGRVNDELAAAVKVPASDDRLAGFATWR